MIHHNTKVHSILLLANTNRILGIRFKNPPNELFDVDIEDLKYVGLSFEHLQSFSQQQLINRNNMLITEEELILPFPVKAYTPNRQEARLLARLIKNQNT